MIYPNFKEIKRVCDGMMREDVYAKIYETAYNAKGNKFIEIGSAHGAATVCLALGLINSGKTDGVIYTFDKFDRGGRTAYLDPIENYNKIIQNLKTFKVNENVKVINGDIANTYSYLQDIDSFDLIMLDSDGQIDRDFGFFYERLNEDAPIIIDDMADRSRITITSQNREKASIDQKHKLTFMLTNSAEKWGLIEKETMVYQTWFGKKKPEKIIKNWSKKDILKCYRSLVFSTGEVKYKG